MKIEYIYEDETYKSIINNIDLGDSQIVYDEDNPNIFSIETNKNDETAAKLISRVHSDIIKELNPQKYFILSDEVSMYFNRRLYPLYNQFERLLRKLLYIVCIKTKKGQKTIRQIESKTFGNIYSELFTRNYETEFRARIKNKTFTKSEILDIAKSIPENPLWNDLIPNSEGNFIKNNFKQITEYRNDVMHAHNICYERFHDAEQLIKKANINLELLIELNVDTKHKKQAKCFIDRLAEYTNLIINAVDGINKLGDTITQNINPFMQFIYGVKTNEIDNEKLLCDKSKENNNGQTNNAD